MRMTSFGMLLNLTRDIHQHERMNSQGYYRMQLHMKTTPGQMTRRPEPFGAILQSA